MINLSAHSLVDDELAARFSMEVTELVKYQPSERHAEAASKSAFLFADHCLNLIKAASPEPEEPECRSGCDFCCYNQVELTAPEALLIGSFLAEQFEPVALQRLLARVEIIFDRLAGRTKRELAARRADFPCPLLEAGQCQAYDVRPLMCRAMHSLHAVDCRNEFSDPPLSSVKFYLHRHIIHVSISQGLVDACLELGYQAGPVDLVSAIRQYFSQPGIAHRWLAGQAIFQSYTADD